MFNDGPAARFREWLNERGRPFAIAAAVLLALGAAFMVFRSFGSEQRERDRIMSKGRDFQFVCTNAACKERGKMHAEFNQKFPTKCPKCGQNTAVLGFMCVNPKCHKIIPVVSQLVYHCPECNWLYDNRLPGGEAPGTTGN